MIEDGSALYHAGSQVDVSTLRLSSLSSRKNTIHIRHLKYYIPSHSYPSNSYLLDFFWLIMLCVINIEAWWGYVWYISMMMQKLSRQLLQRTVYSFSGGYFSHRTTTDNNDSTPFDFTPQNYQEVQKILAKYPPNWKRSAIIPLLTLAQKQNDNFLSLAAMRKVARITEVN